MTGREAADSDPTAFGRLPQIRYSVLSSWFWSRLFGASGLGGKASHGDCCSSDWCCQISAVFRIHLHKGFGGCSGSRCTFKVMPHQFLPRGKMILQFGRSQLGVAAFGMLRTRCFSSPVVVRVCACGHAFVCLCARSHSDVLPSLMLIGRDPVPLTSAISYTAGCPATAAVRSSSGRKFCV